MIALLKALWDSHVLHKYTAWVALAAVGFLQLFQIEPLKAEVTETKKLVTDIRVSQMEEKLQKYYTALCMEPGNSLLLAMISDLEADYRALTHHEYQRRDCSLLLTLK